VNPFYDLFEKIEKAEGLQEALRLFDAMCDLRRANWGELHQVEHGRYDPDDFDADELGLDPERDFDA